MTEKTEIVLRTDVKIRGDRSIFDREVEELDDRG